MSASAQRPEEKLCSRCRQHGVAVRRKGHTRRCPFLHCGCCRCRLVAQRSLLDTRHRQLLREPGGPSGGPSGPADGPLDLRLRAAGGGAPVSGVQSEELPSTSGESFNAAAVPLVYVPLRMPAPLHPGPYFLLCGPWLPPVPAASLQQVAVFLPAPPPPAPVADDGDNFLPLLPPPLPDAFQPPLPRPNQPDTEGP